MSDLHLQQQSNLGRDDTDTCLPKEEKSQGVGATQLQHEVHHIWNNNLDFATKRRMRALMRANYRRRLMLPEHEAGVILFTPRMSTMDQKLRNLRQDLNKIPLQLPNPLLEKLRVKLEHLSHEAAMLGNADDIEKIGNEVLKFPCMHHNSKDAGTRAKRLTLIHMLC